MSDAPLGAVPVEPQPEVEVRQWPPDEHPWVKEYNRRAVDIHTLRKQLAEVRALLEEMEQKLAAIGSNTSFYMEGVRAALEPLAARLRHVLEPKA